MMRPTSIFTPKIANSQRHPQGDLGAEEVPPRNRAKPSSSPSPVSRKAKLAAKASEKEQHRVDDRSDDGRDQRRLPPGIVAQAIEDLGVEKLGDEEGRAGRDRDARRGQPDRQHDREREAGQHHLARSPVPEAAVGQVVHEKGKRDR